MARTKWNGGYRDRVLTRLVAVAACLTAAVVVTTGPAAAAVPALGSVGGFDGRNVKGWAASQRCGGNPGAAPNGSCLELRAFYDGPAGRGVPEDLPFRTSRSRPDVAARIGGNGMVGFSHDLRKNAPLRLLDGAPHTVHVYAGGSSAGDPGALIGTTTFATRAYRPVGRVESTAGGVITGWTFDPDAPRRSLSVRVVLSTCGVGAHEVYETRTPANLPRDDVNRARGITGAHGFRHTLPTPDPAGGCLWATVYGEDTERPWDNSRVLTTFRFS